MKKILIEKADMSRKFRARGEDGPAWGAGDTPEEAFYSLITAHPETFGVTIVDVSAKDDKKKGGS